MSSMHMGPPTGCQWARVRPSCQCHWHWHWQCQWHCPWNCAIWSRVHWAPGSKVRYDCHKTHPHHSEHCRGLPTMQREQDRPTGRCGESPGIIMIGAHHRGMIHWQIASPKVQGHIASHTYRTRPSVINAIVTVTKIRPTQAVNVAPRATNKQPKARRPKALESSLAPLARPTIRQR